MPKEYLIDIMPALALTLSVKSSSIRHLLALALLVESFGGRFRAYYQIDSGS